jgi:HAE1 family hydrophobic/amphiphilic exporter-1
MVPMSTLTAIQPSSGPEFIFKYNQYEAVQVNGSAAPGYSSGEAMAALEAVFHETMPVQMGFDYTGMSYQEQQAALGVSPATIFAMSFLVVFLIMAAQYESWSLPFSVLLGTPIAVFGAFLALNLRSLENNVYAQIGLVMLIGLSAKNAILIVEFAKAESERGMPIAAAALAGARLRLRPIMMTAFAFILGCVPLWTASGAGAVARRVLGTTVIGGMLAASLIAIFFIPMTFDLVGRLANRNKPSAPEQLAPEPVRAAHD